MVRYRLAAQLAATERRRVHIAAAADVQEANLTDAIALLADCGRAYRAASDTQRRAYNQAWFTRLILDIDDHDPSHLDVQPRRTPLIDTLHHIATTTPEQRHRIGTTPDTSYLVGDTTPSNNKSGSLRPRRHSRVLGLNNELWWS